MKNKQEPTALTAALLDPIWLNHTLGDRYLMDGKGSWKIAYYPIFEDGETGEQYSEPRVLIEQPAKFKVGDNKWEEGIDFREVPLRYLRAIDQATLNKEKI